MNKSVMLRISVSVFLLALTTVGAGASASRSHLRGVEPVCEGTVDFEVVGIDSHDHESIFLVLLVSETRDC